MVHYADRIIHQKIAILDMAGNGIFSVCVEGTPRLCLWRTELLGIADFTSNSVIQLFLMHHGHCVREWFPTLAFKAHCPACFRCFPPLTSIKVRCACRGVCLEEQGWKKCWLFIKYSLLLPSIQLFPYFLNLSLSFTYDEYLNCHIKL